MQNLSHCTGTWKNGLYGFNKNLSHCTWTGTGKHISIHHRAYFQDLKNGYQTHSSGPENIPGVLPCPCSGAVWKVLIKTIQPILPGPCPGPGSGPSQCEYTISVVDLTQTALTDTKYHSPSQTFTVTFPNFGAKRQKQPLRQECIPVGCVPPHGVCVCVCVCWGSLC